MHGSVETSTAPKSKEKEKSKGKENPLHLVLGVAGIYGAFMYYGVMQSEVTKYKSSEGEKLEREWFLQASSIVALQNKSCVNLCGCFAGARSPC